MQTQTEIRQARPGDYEKLGEVMFDAVRRGHSKYNERQRQAWVPESRKGKDWSERLDAQTVYLAESVNKIVGFMTLCPDGYIDFAYVSPAAQGSGIFRRLYQSIETHALLDNHTRLWVHASLMARAPFEQMGFRVLQQESVVIGDQQLERFKMEKRLVANS